MGIPNGAISQDTCFFFRKVSTGLCLSVMVAFYGLFWLVTCETANDLRHKLYLEYTGT